MRTPDPSRQNATFPSAPSGKTFLPIPIFGVGDEVMVKRGKKKDCLGVVTHVSLRTDYKKYNEVRQVFGVPYYAYGVVFSDTVLRRVEEIHWYRGSGLSECQITQELFDEAKLESLGILRELLAMDSVE